MSGLSTREDEVRPRGGKTPAARWRKALARLRDEPDFACHWQCFGEIFGAGTDDEPPPEVWKPGPQGARGSNLGRFMRERGIGDYRALHAWSTGDPAAFWEAALDRLGIVFRRRPKQVLDDSGGPEHARWLPGAELDCTESCLRGEERRPAIVTARERGPARPAADELRTVGLGELRRTVDRVAHGLRRAGLRPDDAVALYLPLNPECVAAYLGAVRAGCRVVSVPESLPPVELSRRLESAGARALVTVERFTRGGRTLDLYAKARDAGAPQAIVLARSGVRRLRAGDLAWDRFLGEDRPFHCDATDPERVTNVLFSSGTTGEPKAIPWTQLTPLKCAMDGHFHHDIRPGDVVAWPTSIGWMMGPWLIYAALVNGATVALYEGAPTGEGFARFVERAGVTVLGVVPSLVRAWRTSGVLDGADWSRVRLFSSTGEPSNPEDYLWLMSRAGYRAPVIEYCGGTEIGGGYITGTVVQPASPATFTTPALGLDFALLDEAGSEVEEGGTGEVFLRSPSIGLSQRLLNRDHHEAYYAGCPAGPRGETLRRHGDRITRLPGGFYRAAGRADDAMNLGGVKVGPLELERVCNEHETVRESAAVPVRSDAGTDRLVVHVVPAQPIADPARLQRELGRRLAQRLSPLFKIHDLVILDRLPYTPSNKLMRRSLRERYERDDGDRAARPDGSDT